MGVQRGRATRPSLKIGVCGEHGGDPESIALFADAGLDYVSCSPFRVPIARLSAAQAVLAADDAPTPVTRKAVASKKSGSVVGLSPGSVLAVAIPEEDVARVRAATDIVALIGEHAALKRQGTRWVGLCPFHQEKSPSFSVNAEEGLYYCFGCQRSGDAISFVRDVEHVDFVEAVRRLADRCRGHDHRGRGGDGREAAANTALRRHDQGRRLLPPALLAAPDGGPARDYLRSRGYDGDVVRAFKLGWAPEGWDALASHLKVSDRGADRLRPRVREPPGTAPGRLPGPGHLPHLRPLGQGHRPRWADPAVAR